MRLFALVRHRRRSQSLRLVRRENKVRRVNKVRRADKVPLGRRAHGANKVLRAAMEVTARGALLDLVVNRGRRANEGVGGCADFVVWSGPPVKSDPLVLLEHRVNAV